MRIRPLVTVLLALSMLASLSVPAFGHPGEEGEGKDAPHAGDNGFPEVTPGETAATCVDGMAGPFPCDNVDLDAFLPAADIGGGRGSDVWGWTDPETGREYVLAARSTGTAILDVTDSQDPVYLAELPSASRNEVIWRDIKVHDDHAFIVAEASNHGMQVLDLTQLRDLPRDEAPVTLAETARYTDFLRAHNVEVNTETGYAYAVGTREDDHLCLGGLHMIDINEPAEPTFAGCFALDGYTHDAQCVVYAGPHELFQGREICFASNENSLTIVDVTDKSLPVPLARMPYAGFAYTHQGWLTEDHAHFLLNDEGDENRFGHNTKHYIWDVSNLFVPHVIGEHIGETRATTHNNYIVGNYAYGANYRAGLQVFDLTDIADGSLTQVASFDTYPPDDLPGFSHGSWSNYPFFDSGLVAVNGYEGLFLVRPNLPAD